VDSPKPGDFATLGVVVVEDRNGRALVRLPNGTKTSVSYSALRGLGGPVHFVRDLTGEGETVYCQACDWELHGGTRVVAEDAYLEHRLTSHRDP
jgi:hypothetical protein